MRTIWMLALFLGALTSAAACGDITEGIANQALEDQGARIDGETVTVENPDGTVTTAGTGLPAGWPTAFPFPEGHQVLGSISGSGQHDIVASITVPGSVADNTVFLSDTLPKSGFPRGAEMSLLAVTLEQSPR